MTSFSLLGLCGALRRASTNRLLMNEAARLFDPETFVEADLNLPLYDGDAEAADGIPQSVLTLSDQIKAADAVVISCPEYNKGITGVLKNALDWISRTDDAPWVGKPVALVSATAGRAGGERCQTMLRNCMVPFRPNLLSGPEVLVAASSQQFDDDGRLMNEINLKALTQLMQALRDAASASK